MRLDRLREAGNQTMARSAVAPLPPSFELLSLPHDVLQHVLAQPSLGARELCRLEQTSQLVRSFIDDDVCWRRVFLASRRRPALGVPSSWKSELTNREDWSRSWRQRGLADTDGQSPDEPSLLRSSDASQLGASIVRCVSTPSRKKLRRLALMMFPGHLCSSHGHHDVHIVDPSHPEAFASISAAIACARPQETVLVAPGTYHERLEIDKPGDILGMGPIGSVTLIGTDGPVVQVASSRVACRIAKLRIQQHIGAESAPMSGAVRVEGGAVLVLEECSISSMSGHCVVVKGADSCGYILHNQVTRRLSLLPVPPLPPLPPRRAAAAHSALCSLDQLAVRPLARGLLLSSPSALTFNPQLQPHRAQVHKAKGVGVLICDHARGLIEDNDICENARAGVAILSGGNPVVRLNRIHDGKDSGVLVSEKGRGRIEENDIFSNLRAGVAILREGAPFVARNRIFDGYDSGVLVCEQGKGSVVDNDIFANQMAGVAIGHGGASAVKGNTIRDGTGGSLLCLSSHSKGLICANVIDQDPGAALQVPDGLLPEVQEQNLIRFIGSVHLSC